MSWVVKRNVEDNSHVSWRKQSQFIDNKKGEISIQLAKSFYKKYKNTAKNITYQDYPIKDLEPMLLIDKIHELEAKED